MPKRFYLYYDYKLLFADKFTANTYMFPPSLTIFVLFSFLEFPIPKGIAFIGEIGLAGELHTVSTLLHISKME